jgi:hypothetical protein
MTLRAFALVLGLAAVACDSPPPEPAPAPARPKAAPPVTPPPAEPPEPSTTVEVTPADHEVLTAEEIWGSPEPDTWGDLSRTPAKEGPETHAGPAADPGATDDQRRDAVLAILSGGKTPTRLPIVAGDPRAAVPTGGPHVTIGIPKVEGELPPEIVRRIVRSRAVAIQTCYDDALATKPGTAGDLTFAFTIASDGTPTKSRVTGAKLPDDLRDCVARTAMPKKFPRPLDDKPVEATIVVTLEAP